MFRTNGENTKHGETRKSDVNSKSRSAINTKIMVSSKDNSMFCATKRI